MKKLNNNIQESYCSKEIMQLLYDVGLRFPNTSPTEYRVSHSLAEGRFNDGDLSYKDDFTHSLAVEWIRINFGHDVESRGVRYAGDAKSTYYQSYVDGCVISMKKFSTPYESIDAGLIYVLHSLITSR